MSWRGMNSCDAPAVVVGRFCFVSPEAVESVWFGLVWFGLVWFAAQVLGWG